MRDFTSQAWRWACYRKRGRLWKSTIVALSIRDYFGAFIISANHGILKDDTRLFDVAKEQMDTPAENTLFLDDWAPYVQVAINSGFQGAAVARDADTSKVEGLTIHEKPE